MGYDPDLNKVFNEFRAADAALAGRITALEAGVGQQGLRLGALEARGDLAGAVADLRTRLAAAEAAIGVLKAAAAAVPPVSGPKAPAAIWQDLAAEPQLVWPAEIRVPPGTREIHIPLTVGNGHIRQSFHAYVSGMMNLNGGGIDVGDLATQKRLFNLDGGVHLWSPGDDPTHYLKLTCANGYKAGAFAQCNIRVKGLSDAQKGQGVRIVWADDGVIAPRPPQIHRPMRRLDLSGAVRRNSFDPAVERWSASGLDAAGRPVWRSQLAHGREQSGNGETGLYLDGTVEGALNPISHDPAERAIRLHSLAFPETARVEYNSRLFRHQAAVLQGQTMPDVCGSAGVWRMTARIPSRAYSWPAFWLVGLTGWPPEIDIMEKFNGVWGEMDTRSTTTFAQHFGNAGSNIREGAFGSAIEVDQWFGAGPIDQDYHSWACAIVWDAADPRRCEVTFFFDDREIGCHVLFARHQDPAKRIDYYPLVNVAVKAPGGYTADQYNNDEKRGGLSGDMLVRDVAYYPAGFALRETA